MSSNTLLICVAACVFQIFMTTLAAPIYLMATVLTIFFASILNALCQVLSLNNCGQQSQGINLSNLGLAVGNPGGLSLGNSGLSLSNSGLTLGNAGNGISLGGLTLGNSQNLGFSNLQSNNCNNVVQSTSQQIGYGDMAIVGEVPVQGPTAVCGNVPVIGYVVFEGDVPAGGLVSVVDPCGCPCSN